MSNMTVTEAIDKLLKEKNIKKGQFYKDCGITSAAYSLWKQGKTVPSMRNLEKIAGYLDVSLSDLVANEPGGKIVAVAQHPEKAIVLDMVGSIDDTQFLLDVIEAATKQLKNK